MSTTMSTTTTTTTPAYRLAALGGTLFQVPTVAAGDDSTRASCRLAFLVDASGSMGQVWASVAQMVGAMTAASGHRERPLIVTFDGVGRVCPGALNTNIGAHGGGTTNIAAGFRKLSQQLAILNRKYPMPTGIVFISDGCDDRGAQASDMISREVSNLMWPNDSSFICCGVGTGFPTSLAMGLRASIHKGSFSESPLVLVVPNGITFVEAGPRLLQNLNIGIQPLRVSRGVAIFPWEDVPTQEVHPGSFVIIRGAVAEDDPITLTIGNRLVQLELAQTVPTSFCEGVARAWMNQLQQLALRGNAESQARVAIEWLRALEAATIPPAEPCDERARGPSMLTRMQIKSARGAEVLLRTLLNEVEAIARGDGLSGLTDAQKAVRLQIGTLDGGRHHLRAIDKCGMTDERLTQMRTAFSAALLATPLPADYETSQGPSVLSLDTMADVLRQRGLSEAIQLCDDQFEVVREMPLVGRALRIVRSDASKINPYLVRIEGVPLVAQEVDSQGLAEYHQRQNSRSEAAPADLVMSIGVGGGDAEKVNAVLPLFSLPQDEPMRPFVASDLFKLLVHFQVVGNVETYTPFSYLAALSVFWVYLAEHHPEAEWSTRTMENLCSTALLAYGEGPVISAYRAALEQEDPHTLVTDHPDNAFKCEHLIKPLFLLGVSRRGVSPDAPRGVSRDFGCKILIEFFGRAVPADKLSRFFTNDLSWAGQYDEAVERTVNYCLGQNYMTLDHLGTAACAQMLNCFGGGACRLRMDKVRAIRLYGLSISGIFASLRQIGTSPDILAELESPAVLSACLYTASLETSSYARNHSPQRTIDELLTQSPAELQKKLLHRALAKAYVTFEKGTSFVGLREEYANRMRALHTQTFPMTRSQLEYAALTCDPEVDAATLQRSRSGLLRNACACAACPFFLQVSPHVHSHLRDMGGATPGYHLSALTYRNFPVARALDTCARGALLQGNRGAVAFENSRPEEMQMYQEIYQQWTPADLDDLPAPPGL